MHVDDLSVIHFKRGRDIKIAAQTVLPLSSTPKNMSLTTFEIRWFVERQPLEESEIFGQQPAERTDWYAPSGNGCTGTKVREGRLETKLLTDDMGLLSGRGAVGVMQRWEKWSAVLEGELPSDTQLRNAGWVAVRKHRWAQVWSTESETPQLTEDRVGRGALFEVTQLLAEGQTWWTIGCESFGPEGTREASLRAVIDHVLGEHPLAFELGAADSKSYPEWLLLL